MTSIRISRAPRRVTARLYLALTVVMFAAASWLRGDHVADDRGSDSTEKASNIILAVAISGTVAIAATALVLKLTGKF